MTASYGMLVYIRSISRLLENINLFEGPTGPEEKRSVRLLYGLLKVLSESCWVSVDLDFDDASVTSTNLLTRSF